MMSNGDPTGLRATLFGNLPLDRWPPTATASEGAAPEGEPWVSFERARTAVEAGDRDAAVSIWRSLTEAPDLEARHALQAWHFLRAAGVQPPADEAKRVLGTVAEVAIDDRHDVLAAYADGSVRYLNARGSAVIVDDSTPRIDAAVTALLDVARDIARAIGPWEEPDLPLLPAGHTRLTILTPSGLHLGQGPDEALRPDPMAAPFFDAATTLLIAVTDLATTDP